MFLTLLGPQTVSGVVTVLDDVTTRSGGQIPLLLTSGSYANAIGTVTAGSGNITGTLSRSLGDLAASSAGAVQVAGTLAATLAAVTVSSNGAVTVKGSLSATLGELAGSATGTVTSGPTGALNGILDDIIATAIGAAHGGQQASGGYGWQNVANASKQRRRRRAVKRDEPASDEQPEKPTQATEDDLELIRNLVAFWTGQADRALLDRRAQRALDRALQAETVLAMQLFERELHRNMLMDEEEQAAALLLILND